jgi:hypothetical protein
MSYREQHVTDFISKEISGEFDFLADEIFRNNPF